MNIGAGAYPAGLERSSARTVSAAALKKHGVLAEIAAVDVRYFAPQAVPGVRRVAAALCFGRHHRVA
ncbi:MAG: hypothetical protein ACR2IK_16310 [Chloroflexota bacterium]